MSAESTGPFQGLDSLPVNLDLTSFGEPEALHHILESSVSTLEKQLTSFIDIPFSEFQADSAFMPALFGALRAVEDVLLILRADNENVRQRSQGFELPRKEFAKFVATLQAMADFEGSIGFQDWRAAKHEAIELRELIAERLLS